MEHGQRRVGSCKPCLQRRVQLWAEQLAGFGFPRVMWTSSTRRAGEKIRKKCECKTTKMGGKGERVGRPRTGKLLTSALVS